MTRVAVTGATGWLGRAASELVARRGDELLPFASAAKELRLDSGETVPVAPLDELVGTPHDVLMHFAYATREHAGAGAADYIATNVRITGTVVEAIARQRPRAVVYASSGAVHLAGGGLAWDVEAEPYSALKRLDELTLGAAARAVGAAAIISRVFNLAGPWLLKRGFAIADLIAQVEAGGPVQIRARHPVVRSYVDVEDLVALLLALADRGASATFDTAGEVAVEMGELATRIAAVLGAGPIDVERDWDPAADPNRYVGDPAEIRRLAAEAGVAFRNLDDQIRRTRAALGEVAR